MLRSSGKERDKKRKKDTHGHTAPPFRADSWEAFMAERLTINLLIMNLSNSSHTKCRRYGGIKRGIGGRLVES